jgi:hypothetical protein
MELQKDNVDAYIVQCITNAWTTIHRNYSDENEEPSLTDETYSHEDLSYSANDYLFSLGEEVDNDTISYLSNDEDSRKDISLYDSSKQSSSSDMEDSDGSTRMQKSVNSADSNKRNNGDNIPKTFLQLKGISIANYNMGCNFDIAMAIRIMIQYDLTILAIQEHTPWNKDLTPMKISSFEWTCHKWGFSITISKLQILIIDNQVQACHREIEIYEDGRIIKSRFEISSRTYANFVAVYGIPHSSDNYIRINQETIEENLLLQRMRQTQKQIKKLSMNIIRNKELIYIFGDLQDTPDDSKNFYYGKNKIAKHPLGIVKTCEDIGLQCTIYKQWNEIERPIISRHGSKGGRFIDGMYTCRNGLLHVQGITIIHDTGILRDHDMVITKCDLGIEKFQINKAKEERCD